MFSCPCNRVLFSSAEAYLAHYLVKHTVEIASKEMVCGFSKCIGRKFDKLNSFRKHIKTHRCGSGSPNNGILTAEQPPYVSAPILEDSVDVLMLDETQHSSDQDACKRSPSPTSDSVSFDNALLNAVITYISFLYDCGTFTESQIQQIIEAHKHLLGGGFLEILKKKTVSLLEKETVPDYDLKAVAQMFDSCINMFDGLETHFKREAELEKCGAFIPPEYFSISHADEDRTVDGVVVKVPIELKGQFVSFRKVLKGFLELPGVYQAIFDYTESLELVSDNSLIENVIQGDLWQKIIKPKFSGKSVLPLNFLFDDYETGKELGTHTGVYKLGAGYINIPCIPPKFRSLLENYFLVILFHSADRAKGNEAVFRKLINELKFLEDEGICIVTANGVKQVYFALCLVIGDNLGANGILGFVESFSAFYYCRVCSEHKHVAQFQSEANPQKRRTRDSYENDLLINNYSLTGRKTKCVFNVLKSFHVSENIHLDSMHDLDSGVWDYIMFEIVYYLYKKKRLSLDQLNNQIQGFYYGPNEERNKVPYISYEDLIKNKRLRFSASEMRCFVRYFGLMVGNFIKDEDLKVWDLYLKVRHIVDIVTAPCVLRSDLDVLRELIRKLLSNFIEIFNTHLQPKFHFLIHYPELMSMLGPLEALTCYRMELKHKEGKNIAAKSHNRINLPLTIMKRHQLRFAFRLLSGRGFVAKYHYTSIQSVPLNQICEYVKFAHVIPINKSGLWSTVKSLQINGAIYKIGGVVLHSLKDDGSPWFGEIHVISVWPQENAYFVLKMFDVVHFDNHFYAYEVQRSQDWCFINYKELLTFAPTEVRVLLCKNYISVRSVTRK